MITPDTAKFLVVITFIVVEIALIYLAIGRK